MELLVFHNLQIRSIELHIAFFYQFDPLHLVTVLLILVSALFLGRIHTLQPLLHLAYRPKGLLFTLIADLPWLLLAVLGIAVLLGLLGTSLHLELAYLLRFKVAVLLLNREGEDVGELLAIPVNVSLANFDLDLSWDVVAVLGGFPAADHTLGSIAIVLGGLVSLTVEFHGVGAGNVVDYLFLHVAIRGLDVGALIVILGSHVDLVCGVTHPVLASEAPLYLIGLLQGLVGIA